MQTICDSIKTILQSRPQKIVLSGAASQNSPYQKIVIEKIGQQFQAAQFTSQQVFHKNMHQNELQAFLQTQIPEKFKQLAAFSDEGEYSIRISKKGKATLIKRQPSHLAAARTAHNREKAYLLKEGEHIPPLVDMGVFTKEGKVVSSMQDKFRQINRFIEVVDDVTKHDQTGEMQIIDYGCGKGYLTFLLYYYFHEMRGIPVQMRGVDLKADVMRSCNAAAEKYGYTGLRFVAGDIASYVPDIAPQMVVSLHACDTATDLVLASAVKQGAKYIFSMPCCQHELGAQMQTEALSLLTRYGAIKEKTAALFTDALRANLLVCCGYKTQILEVINPLSTPKNLMIRAVKASLPENTKAKALAEVQALIKQFHLDPTLYRLLRETVEENPPPVSTNLEGM